MTGIWNKKPHYVWVPRGYYSKVRIKDDDIQMLILEETDIWLKKLMRYYHDWISDQKKELDEKTDFVDILENETTKLEAVRDMISTDLSNHDKLNAIEDILRG